MLFFALDENKEIVFIQKAIKKKDYYCPECGGILRVKSGTKKCKHFFHLNCENCGTSGESLAHKYFKEHFTEFLSFIPIKEKMETDKTFIENRTVEVIVDNTYVKYTHKHETNLKTKRKKYNIKSFQVETPIRKNGITIIPDVIVELENGEQCAVEIFYTNKKTDKHKEKYRQLKLSAIEIKIDEKCNILGVRTLYNKNDLKDDFDKYNNETINSIKKRLPLKQDHIVKRHRIINYEFDCNLFKSIRIESVIERTWESLYSKIHKQKTFENLNYLLQDFEYGHFKDYYWFLLKDCVLNRSENYDWFFIKNAKKLYLHSYINYIDEKDRNTDIIIIDLMYKDEIIKRINEFVMEVEGDEF